MIERDKTKVLCLCTVVGIFLVSAAGSTLIASSAAFCKRSRRLVSAQNITNVPCDASVWKKTPSCLAPLALDRRIFLCLLQPGVDVSWAAPLQTLCTGSGGSLAAGESTQRGTSRNSHPAPSNKHLFRPSLPVWWMLEQRYDKQTAVWATLF